MSDEIKDMIGHAMNKNASGFEDAFNSLMSDKMDAALTQQYDAMFGAPQAEVAEDEAVDAPEELDSETEE